MGSGVSKHLFPWEDTVIFEVGGAFCRRDLAGRCQFTIWQQYGYWYFAMSANDHLYRFKTAEAAKGACDKQLIERGWYLIGEEEVERWEGRRTLL